MTQMAVLALTAGDDRLVDLALDAAIELEGKALGESFDPAPIKKLADALVEVSESSESTPNSTYHEPLRRLAFALPGHVDPLKNHEIPTFVRGFADDLRALVENGDAGKTKVDQLLDSCLTFHTALLKVSRAARTARRPKRTPATAGFRAP